MASLTRCILLLWLQASTCLGWSVSRYLANETLTGFFSDTSVRAYTVTPTGGAKPTATTVRTEIFQSFFFDMAVVANLTVTVTDMYFPYKENGGWCDGINYPCSSSQPTPAPSSGGAAARAYIPVTISNPSTCTRTSYVYTTSYLAGHMSGSDENDQSLNDAMELQLGEQLVQTGPSGEAASATSYTEALSTDLGGQAIATSRYDVWLKPTAVTATELLMGREGGYQSQCVDPRRYLCSDSKKAEDGKCGTDWVAPYGSPTATGKGQGQGQGQGSGTSETGAAHTTSSSVGGTQFPCSLWALCAPLVSAVFLLASF